MNSRCNRMYRRENGRRVEDARFRNVRRNFKFIR